MLACVLVALAGYFALFEGFSVTPAPESHAADHLLDCAAGPPREIAVATAYGVVSGRLVDGRWQSDAGGLAPVAFETLAETLCRLPVIDRIASGAKLADFGLDPPQAKLAIGLGGEKELWIGSATPAENLLYAKFADQGDIVKLGAELKSVVDRTAGYAERESRPD